MKQFSLICGLLGILILASCSKNDEPTSSGLMRPSSIVSSDSDGLNQTFGYDSKGRVISWYCQPSGDQSHLLYSAQYSYIDDSAIEVTAKDVIGGMLRDFKETIFLNNGRCCSSEGTFVLTENGNVQIRKSYRLQFTYDSTNHLTIVKHSEIMGIGEEVRDNAWDKAWTWENYLIWEEGNLTEYQDYAGNSKPTSTTKFEYSILATSQPIVIPMLVYAHYLPLTMQGVLGTNSVNLVELESKLDAKGNLLNSRQYSYELEQARIVGYTEYLVNDNLLSSSLHYNVNWLEIQQKSK